jgi:hypothetical protein
MLRRITFDRYEADLGDQIQIVAKARNNNGVNDARFEYASSVLPREVIQGLPGATFTVLAGRNRVQAVVAFDPGAGGTARYDLFEVDASGGLSDLRQHVSQIDSAPLVGFAVEGVPVGAAVTRGMPIARRSVPARAGRKTAARKKTTGRTATAKKSAGKRATPKSPTKKQTSGKKTTRSRSSSKQRAAGPSSRKRASSTPTQTRRGTTSRKSR